ncbi:hypothetical protein HY229_02855 [Candidatus Acetothermia bacterium]|nr:hypothetical protein [Candidatus Acetothermia bacterium]MBI3643022.1 hypothetical protein [Candidatus Acetothermia bacterium]
MAQFSEIEESKATPEIQQIFRDVQLALRFSDVPWLFRMLASHPGFLKIAWTAIKPTITDFFESSADQIRSHAISKINSSLSGNNLRAGLKKIMLKEDEINAISENILAYHFVHPKLLLMTTALKDSLAEKPVGVTSIVVRPTGRGVPVGIPRIKRVDVGSATGKAKVALGESAKLQSLPVNSDLMLTLGQWPDALGTLWDNLKIAIQSNKYASLLEETSQSATEGVQHLRRRIDLGREELALVGINEAERLEIIANVTAAQTYYLKSLLDSAYLSLSLAGPEASAMSGEAMLIRWALPRRS